MENCNPVRWLGRPQDMVASVERVVPAWSEDIPGYVAILGCRCFAHEEAGNYLVAEPFGRRAIPPERYVGWREAANRAAVGASLGAMGARLHAMHCER